MTTNLELVQIRNHALGKLKRGSPEADLALFTEEDRLKIDNIIDDFYINGKFQSEDWKGVVMQIYSDIARRYKKFDALAMWLDPDSGLAKYEPELIKKIAVEIGGLKTK